MFSNRPIVDQLLQFQKQAPVSFHVPGHKNGCLSELPKPFQAVLPFDVTELSGLDDLHQPTEIIAKAQQKLAQLYGAQESYFLVNGSTVGNLAMIYATCQKDDIVLVQRNAHKSVFNGLELVGARPVLMTPQWDDKTLSVGTIGKLQLAEAIERYPEARAIILTTPTYYGVTAQTLAEGIALAHEHAIPVLIDEAHGAHLTIGAPFPVSALQLGADVVVHSAHKTLPAMTMGSFLHVNSSLVCHKKVFKYLQMLQSSSPSYLLMASLDDARNYVETYTAKDLSYFLAKRENLLHCLREIPSLDIVLSNDPLKFLLRVEGYTGYQLLEALEKEQIYVELADAYQVLLILPLLKIGHAINIEMIQGKMQAAIKGLLSQEKQGKDNLLPYLEDDLRVLSYTSEELEAFSTVWLPFKEAIGKVAAEAIIPYPPGIPLLVQGERVTEKDAQALSFLTEMNSHFQGAICLKNKEILVVANELGEYNE